MTELKTETQDVKTETLDVPGARLRYDIRDAEAESTAPTLLMIGSPMDASGFTTLAEHFRDRTVVTYDPRGVSRSRTDRRGHTIDAGRACGRPAPCDRRAGHRAGGHLRQQRWRGQRCGARGPAS